MAKSVYVGGCSLHRVDSRLAVSVTPSRLPSVGKELTHEICNLSPGELENSKNNSTEYFLSELIDQYSGVIVEWTRLPVKTKY